MTQKDMLKLTSALKTSLVLHFVASCTDRECLCNLVGAIECFQDDVEDGLDISLALWKYFEYEKKLIDKYSTNHSS